MPAPVKISDRLLARAKQEARDSHRSVTAQIEHWATLGRAVEVMAGHRDVLMLKRAGERLAMPSWVRRDEVEAALTHLLPDSDRESVKARIRAGGGPLYEADPEDTERVIQIAADGRRTRGRFEGRTFVSDERERSPIRIAARRRR
jgi:ParD-like antitoxin of type II bacterial toxin-antitoxin system